MKIFINPGHGGIDPGACGNGLKESEVALNIANMTAQCLTASAFDVKVLQRGGFDGDLDEICDAANDWDADLFISIHCNSFNGTANGTETYYYEGSAAGKRLAECVQRRLTYALPLRDRGIKTANFFVLRHTICPAILIETAFIDCPADAAFLRDSQDIFARNIAFAVIDFT